MKSPANLRYPKYTDDQKLGLRYKLAMQRIMRETDKWSFFEAILSHSVEIEKVLCNQQGWSPANYDFIIVLFIVKLTNKI